MLSYLWGLQATYELEDQSWQDDKGPARASYCDHAALAPFRCGAVRGVTCLGLVEPQAGYPIAC